MEFSNLEPLAHLIALRQEVPAQTARLLTYVAGHNVDGLVDELGGTQVVLDCLELAGILSPDGSFTDDAHDLVLMAAVTSRVRSEAPKEWLPVMTVPSYFRSFLAGGEFLETSQVIRQLVTSATESLVLAAPFLDEGIRALLPAIARHVNEGGQCLVVTRDLLEKGTKGRNRAVIQSLRGMITNRAGLRVESWQGDGLGIHMKVVIADGVRCYIGSANLTHGGLGHHVELGVLCEGDAVSRISDLVGHVATAIHESSSWQAR